VTQAWRLLDYTKAAHIVPYAIDEINAAYIFGVPQSEGYKTLWSWRNGLVLKQYIEKYWDQARIVIVSADEFSDELRMVVLDDSILNHRAYLNGPLFKDLNNTSLVFKIEARSRKRYLYFLCLMSLFRRHRFMVEGYQHDHSKIQMGKIWGTPGSWMKSSGMRALALEVGDILQQEKVLGGEYDTELFSGEQPTFLEGSGRGCTSS
jgi:hypothetical protein